MSSSRTPAGLPNVPAPGNGVHRGRFLLLVADPATEVDGAFVEQLASHHVDAHVYHHAADALVQAGSLRPDAVLVAADLPSISSTEVVRVLCQRAGIAVVVGVGDRDGVAAAAALSAGATVCVARPYRLGEIIPILRAIRPETVGTLDPPIEVGALRLDPATLEVHLHGRVLRLPLKEFHLLRFFMTHADRVVTREQIQSVVWGGGDGRGGDGRGGDGRGGEGSNTLTVHIRRLRTRLGDNLDEPCIIVTVRGMGYRLIPPG